MERGKGITEIALIEKFEVGNCPWSKRKVAPPCKRISTVHIEWKARDHG